jgi:hypothetical protein
MSDKVLPVCRRTKWLCNFPDFPNAKLWVFFSMCWVSKEGNAKKKSKKEGEREISREVSGTSSLT